VSGDLLQIARPAGGRLTEAQRRALRDLYATVPAVRCGCDRPGQCCRLTEEEAADGWATMYPLYPVEYLNIADYLDEHVEPARRDALLSRTDERPMQCPFLSGDGGCSIHPVRPMACRTYGVLSREEVDAVPAAFRGTYPDPWLKQFVKNERCAVCEHTEGVEPEKKEAHTDKMASFHYERSLIELSRQADGLDGPRREALRQATGKSRVTRWTWGGFNALVQTPLSWVREHLGAYLSASAFAE
jgi:Fe-S-cluster containining protein